MRLARGGRPSTPRVSWTPAAGQHLGGRRREHPVKAGGASLPLPSISRTTSTRRHRCPPRPQGRLHRHPDSAGASPELRAQGWLPLVAPSPPEDAAAAAFRQSSVPVVSVRPTAGARGALASAAGRRRLPLTGRSRPPDAAGRDSALTLPLTPGQEQGRSSSSVHAASRPSGKKGKKAICEIDKDREDH
uniref:Uncharacterized protein n=1 Tax=Oryza punctata TaxID=4537 RepID=A0A0E0M1U8_ORYPU